MKAHKLIPTHSSIAAALAVLAALLTHFAAPSAFASIYYWDSSGATPGYGNTTGTWGTSAFWTLTSGGGSPHSAVTATTTSDSVNFGDATLNYTNAAVAVAAAGVSVGNISFGAGQSTALTVGTAANTITLAAASTITVSNASAGATISSLLAGAGTSVTKAGPGLLLLTGANTGLVGGDAFVNAGTLRLGSSASALGGATGPTIQLGDTSGSASAALQIGNSLTILNNITVRPGSSGLKTVGISTTVNANYSGIITANDDVTFLEDRTTGSATLAVNNTSGSSTIATNKTVTFSNTGILGLNDTAIWGGLGKMAYNGSSSGSITISGQKTYSGGCTLNAFSGTGIIGVSGNSTPTSGTLTSGPFGTGTLTLNSGSKMRVSGTTADFTIGNAITIGGDPTFPTAAGERFLSFTGNADLGAVTRTFTCNVGSTVAGKYVEFAGIISGTGSAGIIQASTNAGGTLKLSGVNTYPGSTTIKGGTLALGASGSLPAGSSVTMASGTTFDVSAQAIYTHGASASLTATGTNNVPAVIFGGTTVDLGSRPVTLNYTPDTFAGDSDSQALTISQGSLNINSAITVVNNGASPLGNGTYVVIHVVGGSSTGTPTLNGAVGGKGIAAGKTASIQLNGGTGDIELVVQDALTPTIALTRHNGTINNNTYGAALQFDVSVTGAGPTPTGTVELRDGSTGGTLLGSGSLAGGTVTIAPALNAITGGAHTLYAVYAGDSTYAVGNNTLSQTVVALPVTVTGASASNKFFDGTTTATVTGGTVNTPVTGDTATEINVSSVGTFANVGPGTGISVTVVLGGTKASSYSLTSANAVTADITASPIWTNVLGGTWSTAGNWLNNAVGSGANVTVDFNSVDLTADTTVTNDTARTVGNLTFGDTSPSSAASWVVTGNPITLASATPTITVNALGTGAKVTINSSLTGTSGLRKNGTGTLTLGGVNSYSGGLTVNDGTLNFIGSANTFTGGVTNNGGTLAVNNMNQIGANAINFNGGAFSYSGGTFTSETLTLNLLGGTSTLNVNTLSTETLRTGAAVTGSGNLIKGGVGILALGKNNVSTPLGNTFTGKITVTAGQLDIRQSDSLGSTNGITEFINTTLFIDPFGQAAGVTFDAEPLVFSGSSYIRNYNQSAFVSQINTLTGPMTNCGALGIYSQSAGGYAELDITGDLTNTVGSSLLLGNIPSGFGGPSTSPQFINLSGAVSGPAGVTTVGDDAANYVYTLANNNYSGNTTVNGGTLKLGLANLSAASTVTVASGAILELDFGVANTVKSLILGGVTQPAGVYDSTTGAPYITGSGSLLVASSAPPTLNVASLGGGHLQFSWTGGGTLQAQTNSLGAGLGTNWVDYPGASPVTITINPANGSVFYRVKQ
ncbi:MAG: autotransporter-associated beta strand repeat-containing protein [Verrucomicrobiota bacterium]